MRSFVPRSVCKNLRSDSKPQIAECSATILKNSLPGTGLTLGVVALPELVLLVVTATEDGVTDELDSEDTCGANETEVGWVQGQVSSSRAISEWDPEKVTNREHVTETVRCDILRECGGELPRRYLVLSRHIPS